MTVLVDVDLTSGKHIVLRAEWRYKELCKSIPGASWSPKEEVWRIHVGDKGGISRAHKPKFRNEKEIEYQGDCSTSKSRE